MTDLELLFLVLGIIYVWECGLWARRGSLGFRTWLWTRWTVAQPSKLLGNQNAGVILAHPLPPLGSLLLSHCFPLSISPEAVLSHVPSSIDPARRSSQSERLFRFYEIKQVEVKGRKVLLNGHLLLKAASPGLASQLAALLDGLQKTKAPDRQRAIEKAIENSFDTKAIERRWKDCVDNTSGLRQSTNLLFFYVFLLAPVVLWRFGLNLSWVWLLLGLLCCTVTIALQFHRTHKRLYPQCEDERFTHFIILLLSPASAMRACDLLTRPLLEAFHPLAIARVFCSEPTFTRLAGEFLRESRYPALSVEPEPVSEAIERFSSELTFKRLEEFLRKNGCRPEKLLKPPPRAEQSCNSFCPRCHAQFTLQEGTCPDCSSVKLVLFVE